MEQGFTHKIHRQARPTVRYRDVVWRLITSFVVSLIGISVSAFMGGTVQTERMEFVGGTVVYFTIMLAGLSGVRFLTIRLDARFPWVYFRNSRTVFQLFFCWILPVLLMYGALRSVLALPQLDALSRGWSNHLDWVVVFLAWIVLAFNMGYACAYFIALSIHSEKRAWKGLRLARLARLRYGPIRASQQAEPIGNDELVETTGEAVDGKPEVVVSEEAVADLHEKPTKKMQKREYPDKPADGQYEYVTGKRTELIDFKNILRFESMLKGPVFMVRHENEREVIKQRSIVEIEALTGGYFRKVGRNLAIPHHRLKRCVARGRELELTLFPDDETVMVSKDFAPRLRGWVLSRIAIERVTTGGS